MSCSENTAEKRSFGLSCARAGKAAVAARMPVPARNWRRVAWCVMRILPVASWLARLSGGRTVEGGESCLHPIDVRRDAGEKLEGAYRLEHRHAFARHGPATKAPRVTEQFRLQRKVDDIGHPVARLDTGGRQRHARPLRHADGRGIDDAVAPRCGGGDVGNRFGPSGSEPTRKTRSELSGLCRLDVSNPQPADAALEQGMAYGRASAAGAKQQYGIPRRFAHLAAEAFPKTPYIRVVAEATAIPEDHGVDRTHLAGGRRQLV